jgi:hypothetical protein
MRKIILLLIVLLFAVPVWAGSVDIKCRELAWDGNTVVISYKVNSEPNLVRAFALDIYVNQGAKIKSISGYKVGESVGPSNKGYGIFPGSFDKYEIDPEDPNWADPNYTPFADPCDYPTDTLGGVDANGKLIDTNGITVEMGALYYPTKDNSPNAPPTTGDLLWVTVKGVTPGCKMTIKPNVARGGVVLTNPNEPFDVNSLGYTFNYCMTNVGDTEYKDWVAWARPKCWCFKRQCRGDIDGISKFGIWVSLEDLTILRNGYTKSDLVLATIPNGICGDIDHKAKFKIRVSLEDLTILRTYYTKPQASVPVCDLAPVITGPYNFWTVP